MKTLITHHGKFHADDVFSTAWLKKIYGDIEIIRIDRNDINKYLEDVNYREAVNIAYERYVI